MNIKPMNLYRSWLYKACEKSGKIHVSWNDFLYTPGLCVNEIIAYPGQNNILAWNNIMPWFSNTKNVAWRAFVSPAVLVTTPMSFFTCDFVCQFTLHTSDSICRRRRLRTPKVQVGLWAKEKAGPRTEPKACLQLCYSCPHSSPYNTLIPLMPCIPSSTWHSTWKFPQ